MNTLPCTIDDLLEIADGGDSARANLANAMKTLKSAAPQVTLVAHADGTLIMSHVFDGGVEDAFVVMLAARLAGRLRKRRSYAVRIKTRSGPRLALARRLAGEHAGAFVACLVDVAAYGGVSRCEKASLLVDAIVWAGMAKKTRELELTARLEQVAAEKDSLRASYARSLTDAMEEHEDRLREQSAAQQELSRLNACHRLILDSAGEGIIRLDKDGRVDFANPAAERILGWTSIEMVEKSFHALVQSKKANREPYRWEETPIRKTLSDGATQRVEHESFWRKDGTSLPVEYVATAMRENDEIVGAVVTLQDITERRVLERQLVQAQKLESIGQLAAGIAHEINTPTQFIGDNLRFLEDAFAELLPALAGNGHTQRGEAGGVTSDGADGEYLVEEIPKAITQSLEGVERVADIVRSMKEFSHPGGDEMQSVDLNRAIESAATVSRNEWKYVADLVMDLDPALPMVSCLPGACNQVFLNLIINAAHAIADQQKADGGKRGTISLRTRGDGDWVEIRVADTGTGIPEENRAKVFDPFFTTKDVGRGTGQGLAIAHSVVVEKHGGRISFETELGRGTTFIVRLRNTPDSFHGR